MSSTKFIARNGLAVGTSPVDVVDSTGELLINAPTASKLLTARTISLSGDVVGSVSFDGSGNAAIATTIQADSVALGTDTTGNYMLNVSAGTGVSVSHTQSEGSTATVSIGQAVGTSDNVTFNSVTVNGTLTSDDITSTNISVAGNATITGDLTVSGTTTTINSTTIAIADLNLELARNATTAAAANGAGITVTGPVTPATLTYTSADDRWNLNKNLNVSTVYGALSGNASTATTLQTTRAIQGVNFDGSAAITVVTAGTGISVSGTAVTNTGILSISGTAPVSASTVSGATTISMAAATASVNGYMTSTYAAKLDGIAAGATNVTNTNQLTNGAGYVTSSGVTSVSGTAPVVSSGGTTPAISMAAASSGVNGYMTGTYATKLDGIATGATNVTNNNQLTNGAGYITGSGNTTGSAGSVAGLTLTSSSNGINPDSVTQNQLGYNNSVSLFGQTDGGLYSSAYSSSWVHQIYGDFRTGQIAIRGKNSGTWQAWRTVLDSSNYTSYSPSLTGSGASGTWSINVTGSSGSTSGNAATATTLATNGAVSFTTDNSGIHVIGSESTGSNVRLGSAWSRPGIYNGSGTTSGGAVNSITIGSENSIYFVTQNVERGRFDSSGDGYAANTFRAQAFYDTNDTAYYVDPNSTSSMWNVNIRGDSSSTNTNNQIFFWGAAGTTTSAIGFKASGGNFSNPTGNGDGYNTYLTMDTAGRGWVFREGTGGTNFTSLNNSGWILNNGLWQANASMRAPIFYDSNDTGYYVNPNSTSNLFDLQITGASHKYLYINPGNGQEAMVRYNGGSGSGWYVGKRVSEQLIGQANFHFYSEAAGATVGGIDTSGNMIVTGSHRAPIFYDSNDTSYYANPNASSQFSSLNCNGDFKTNFISGGGGHSFSANHYSMGKDIANGGWSHPHYSDLIIGYHTGVRIGGHYSGTRFYSNSPTTDANNDGNGDGGEALLMTVGGYVGTASHTDVYVNNNLFAGSSMRAPIYYDSNDTGYYVDPASTSNLNILSDPALNDSRLYLRTKGDTNHFLWNAADDYEELVMYFGTGFRVTNSNGNATLLYCYGTTAGNHVYTPTSFRSPIFYDSNDTAYYADPNSGSNLNTANANRFSAPNNGLISVGDDSASQTHNDGSSRSRIYVSSAYPVVTINSTVGGGNSNHGPTLQFTHNGYDSSRQWVIGTGGTGQQLDFGTGQPANKNPHEGIAGYSGTTCMRMTVAGNVGIGGSWGAYGTVANPSYRLHVQGTGYASSDFRAPIFYDSDNTAFYFNPNGESALNTTIIGSNAMYFRSNRNTTSDSPPLQAFSNDGGGAIMSFHRGGAYAVNFGLDSDNVIRIGGWSASANRWQLDMSGNMYAAGLVQAYASDARLKENVVTIDNAIDKIKKLRGVYYHWKDVVDSLGFFPVDRDDIGVIAQEVQEVIPQAVKPAPFDTGCEGKSESGENYLTVQMEKIIPLLIEAVKEQQKQIEELKAEMQVMKNNSIT